MITVMTMLIQIPTPTKGYVNLGDCFVNIAGWMLGPIYGTLSAGIGSAIADIASGYVVYAVATLVIKSAMAAVSYFVFHSISKKHSTFAATIVGAIAAEIIMVAGYALFEGFLYGSVGTALTGIPSNTVQGICGVITSVTLYELILKRVPSLFTQR